MRKNKNNNKTYQISNLPCRCKFASVYSVGLYIIEGESRLSEGTPNMLQEFAR